MLCHWLTAAILRGPVPSALDKPASHLVLKVCFASKESSGDSGDDYTMLDDDFFFAKKLVYGPMRMRAGAFQTIEVTDGDRQFSSMLFTTRPNCSWITPTTSATETNTRIYPRFGFGGFIFFHTNPTPAAGTWHVCYQPSTYADWNLIDGIDLEVVGSASFFPSAGLGGVSSTVSRPH